VGRGDILEPVEPIIEKIKSALISGNAQLVNDLTEKAVSIGVRPSNIIKLGLEPGMRFVGCQFRDFKISIPEVLMISRAMHAALFVLKPLLIKTPSVFKAKIVLGTVAGDLHDIGKNMVGMIMEQAGYEIIDIGIDVPAERFVEAVRENNPDILAMSALLTTSMGEFRDVIKKLKTEKLREKVKIIVGGRPVTPEFALAVGADAYADNPWSSVEIIERLIKKK